MNNTYKLVSTTEIVCAYITYHFTDSQRRDFIAEPIGFIESHTELELASRIEIQVVETTADEVHLILPYYSAVDSIRANHLHDAHLEEVVGGEIGITLTGVFIGSAIGGAIGGTAGLAGFWGGVIGGAIGLGLAVVGYTGLIVYSELDKAERRIAEETGKKSEGK